MPEALSVFASHPPAQLVVKDLEPSIVSTLHEDYLSMLGHSQAKPVTCCSQRYQPCNNVSSQCCGTAHSLGAISNGCST